MSLQGFDILNEKKKKKKTFMDYEPGHVGNDNYVIAKPTRTPKTTTANKTGTAKNETIPNLPKSRLILRSDDDLLKNWDHRAFLEGFYEVDGTTNDWEREKRMSLVDEALKDIEERNRKTNKTPGFANYANASNTVATSGGTTRPPTQEELEAAYADMQQEFSGKNTGKHLNGAAEYVINAATPQNSTKGTTQTPATANAQNKSRDERDAAVRNNYRARQQSEADARYENFDMEAAERKLYDNDYWINRLYESRRQGYGFHGDERIVEERWELEEEIKRAKEAAQRRRLRYIREKVAEMPENKVGDMLRWSSGNMPERGQNTFTVNPRYANTLYPETQPGFYNGNIPQKRYYTGEKLIYGEHTDEALDTMSNILTVASLIPGVDTLADAAAIPVDLLRGDYISAGLDAFGAIPFIGEVADTAKLARAGINIADATHDAAKIVNKADDVADVVKATDDVYSARKVDGTVKAFLDASDNPIAELTKMSGSIAKTSPIKIPENAVIKPKTANKGYYHMEYNWISEDGYEYITRWHTRNPTAPPEQRDIWIIERKIKGIGAGPNHRHGLHQVCVGNNKWISYEEWKKAAVANQLGIATEIQKEWLRNGHWKA